MDRRVARTKKNIYYAFFQLVQTKAIDEITVSELARTADIDRKTFYLHYQTVQDVFVEFKQMIHDRLLEILSEAERRGRENQEKLDAGETLERANDIAPFDFIYFYDSLNVIMMDNMAFFEKLSRDTTFMFLKNDFKNVLKGPSVSGPTGSTTSRCPSTGSATAPSKSSGKPGRWGQQRTCLTRKCPEDRKNKSPGPYGSSDYLLWRFSRTALLPALPGSGAQGTRGSS